MFEKKLQERIEFRELNNKSIQTPSKILDSVATSFQQLEITKHNILTPNRTNFNFEGASPFLINVDCRRLKRKQYAVMNQSKSIENLTKLIGNVDEEIILISDSDDNVECDDDKGHKVDLFGLTQQNIEKHLSMMTTKYRKDSLINVWRNKVNDTSHRKLMMPMNQIELDTFLSEYAAETDSPSIESSQQSVETVVQANPKSLTQGSETEDSFFTAGDQNVVSIPETIVQMQEIYRHFDAENDVVFYENKLSANMKNSTLKVHNYDATTNLNTSSESGTCTDLIVPSEYDTDDLRKELRNDFGDVPGPINKSTKRLYLKRLIRYKRRPPQYLDQIKGVKCSEFVDSNYK